MVQFVHGSFRHANDDTLSIDQAILIIKNDKKVVFNEYTINKVGSKLKFSWGKDRVHEIQYTNMPKAQIPWLGEPELFFECSGKHTDRNAASVFLKNKTAHVIISATSWDSDATLVYGYNHLDYKKSQKIISYGSCTVNGYLPLAQFIDEKYSIIDSDVNVIHNIQNYRLKDNYTMVRKFCTLEKSAPLLMPKISELIKVNYTVIPYDGVSTIDFRFKVSKELDLKSFIIDIKESMNSGSLNELYGMDKIDLGPEVHNCSPFSAVFIEDQIKVLNNNLWPHFPLFYLSYSCLFF